jgi:hypothetical protein
VDGSSFPLVRAISAEGHWIERRMQVALEFQRDALALRALRVVV